MTVWNEADHPRDDDGKFTYKNGENQQSDKEKMQNRADTLYPSMQNKGTMTGGAAEMKDNIEFDNTQFSDDALKKARLFIQKSEKLETVAYQDEKGIWTIGYGHTKGVKEGDTITEKEAEKLYAEDFKIHSEPLKYVKIPLNDNEKVALASLVYNIGEPQFKKSTVLRKLNEGDKKAAAEAFKLFCKETQIKIIDGKPVKKLEFSQGLYNRRLREMKLFLTPEK